MSVESIFLRTTCAQNGLVLSDEQLGQLEAFAALLLDWNKKINLVSRRDEENFFSSHLLHCLSILLKLEIPKDTTILDIGTGGGLPGIPLKIARPDLSLMLLDSTQKKINVVQAIIGELGLEKTEAVWARAEDVGKKPLFAKRFDLVVARAVAPLKDLVKWSLLFLKDDPTDQQENITRRAAGTIKIAKKTLVALKGGNLEGELNEVSDHDQVRDIKVVDLTLVGSTQLEAGEKKIVVVDLHGKKKAN